MCHNIFTLDKLNKREKTLILYRVEVVKYWKHVIQGEKKYWNDYVWVWTVDI